MKLSYDVMLRGRYVGTLVYEYCPLWPLDSDDLAEFTERKLPQVKGQKYKIEFNNKNN